MYRTLTNYRDVEVLNELQILNAEKIVYFADWRSREALLTQVNAVKERRPAERVIFNVFVEDDNGTDGFFLASYDYITNPENYQLDKAQKAFLKDETFHGNEIVANTRRLCLMNMFLHNIGEIDGGVKY